MSARDDSPPPAADFRRFATTQWSVVLAAGGIEPKEARKALSHLCEIYWYPLYGYVRRRVPEVSEAQDLTQAFFAELLEKNYVSAAMPQRGRFRAFLLTAFKHFLSKQWEKARAQKRGGGFSPISLDFDSADSSFSIEPASGLTADQFYDQQWAITLLRQIMGRLEGEFDRAGKARQLEVLKGFIIGDHAGSTYAQAAGELNMTEAAAKKAASRMRGRYRELLREEIAETVAGPEEVEDEIRNLFVILEL
jgi:RNA polymerase sigma-70 factor (ECF subfamily)